MTVKLCSTCKWCVVPESGNFNEGVCKAVVDPFSGGPMNVKTARQDRHPTMAFALPCGYEGLKWVAKT